jgi:uncharacterized protein
MGTFLHFTACWPMNFGIFTQAAVCIFIYSDGKYELKNLGGVAAEGESFQLLVPANCWFAAECAPGTEFSFTGCTMAPGFDFADFELASAEKLSAQYPQHEILINRLCRQ